MPKPSKNKTSRLNSKQIECSLGGPTKLKKTLGAFLAQAEEDVNRCAWDRAIHLLNQITEQAPTHEQAWILLFVACDKSAAHPMILSFADKALAHKPRFVPALIAKAAALRHMYKTQEALDLLKKAISLKPADIQALNLQGIVQKELGLLNDALESFNRCIALKPDYSMAYWNRSDLLKKPRDKDLAFMLKTAENMRSAKQKVRMHFAIARAYEFLGEKDKQFEHIELASKFQRSTNHYDVNIEVQEMNDLRSRFSSAITLDSKIEPEHYPSTPIFLCGLPRSGTTLLEQVLSSHPKVSAGGEINAFPKATSQVLHRSKITAPFPEWIDKLADDQWKEISEKYFSNTRELHNNAYFTDKNLQNYRVIGLIKKALPAAKFIYCKRDPMDTLWGCYKQYFGQGQLFTYSQKDLGLMWQAANATMQYWEQLLGDQLFIFDYEDFVENQEAVTKRLLEFVGLSWSDSCLNFHKNPRAVQTISSMQVREPLSNQRVGQWRAYEQGLSELYELVKQST